MHEECAREENLKMRAGERADVDELDDHEAHIAEHSRYYFSQEGRALGADKRKIFAGHIKLHSRMKAGKNED